MCKERCVRSLLAVPRGGWPQPPKRLLVKIMKQSINALVTLLGTDKSQKRHAESERTRRACRVPPRKGARARHGDRPPIGRGGPVGGAWRAAASNERLSGRRGTRPLSPAARPPAPSRAVTHLPGPLAELSLSHDGLLRGPRSGVAARSWSLQPSWSMAHLPLDFVLSCWESRETVSEGDVTTPESSVVSSDA